MPNRLEDSRSPYLLQHRNNPVDWYPWGEEAFAKAKSENKPVFLSIGYSSCHWCHVMEHESFEDQEVAKLLNEHFVSIKVDREENPDVDEAYMLAVQLSTGRGGWPMSVFMTPEKLPFFAGTYFPKEDRGQFPGFRSIVQQVANGWSAQRAEFTKAAEEFSKALSHALTREGPKTFTKLEMPLLDDAVRALISEFDTEHGGFGGAPKFPPHSTIAFLLEYAALSAALSPEQSDAAEAAKEQDLARTALGMALMTLEALALGGIHDHVGGGFHRYSTDEIWLLPHFEKMLYDNALLLGNFARAAQVIGSEDEGLSMLFTEAASGIVEWLNEEMLGENGLYYSAMDADSEGEEGKYYVWSESEIRHLLGDRSGNFSAAFSIRPEGNYHDEASGALSGKNVLYQPEPTGSTFEDDLAILKNARHARVKPAVDDKQLIGWNALLMSGLTEAGEMEAAQGIAEVLLGYEKSAGKLPRYIGQGEPVGDAYLEDYAALVLALLDLADVSEEAGNEDHAKRWTAEAQRLAKEMIDRFYDSDNGGFFSTAPTHENLFGRSKPVVDQPTPSGNALAIQAALRLGAEDIARRSLEAFVGWMEKAPHATEAMLTAALWLLSAHPLAELMEQAAPKPEVSEAEVKVSVAPKEIIASEGKGMGTIIIDVPEGWHINSSDPDAKWLTPTHVSIAPLKGSVDYPKAADGMYVGRVEIPFTVHLSAGEKGADFEITVTYQPCTQDACLLPKEDRLNAVVVRG